jgi:hypothetical protein
LNHLIGDAEAGQRRLRFAGRFVLLVQRALGALIDENRVSVRIDQHQTGRAGGRSICTLSKKSGRDDRPQGAVGRQKDMPFAVG